MKYTIKKCLNLGLTIPTGNNLYNSEPWYLFAKSQLLPVLKMEQGGREIFNRILRDSEDENDLLHNLKDHIDMVFSVNTWKYKKLYDVYIAEYNPLWNVEGTEKLTIHREEEGTREGSNDKTGYDELKRTGTETTAYTGSESIAKSGHDSLTKTGKETNEKTGSFSEANSGSIQEARTTFDSDTDYDTNKTTDTTTKTTTYSSTNPVTDELSFTQRKDQTDYNSSDTHSFTNRQDQLTNNTTDKTTYNSSNSIDEGTTGTLDEVQIRERGGNIGVTSSMELINQQIDMADRLPLLRIIALDIAKEISYSY